MCGRYTLSAPAELLAELFGLDQPVEAPARFNVAPSQDVPVVRVVLQEEGRRMDLVRWGLLPFWAKDPAVGQRMINARVEGAAGKPAFRAAFRQRRCLVPADGFYEWRREGGRKQPYLFRLRGGEPFAFAGMWERWTSPDGEVVESCTILTCEANALVAAVHHRMPVILPPEAYDAWLDPSESDPDRLAALLRPLSAERMEAFPVSPAVSNARNEGPDLVEPAGPPLAPRSEDHGKASAAQGRGQTLSLFSDHDDEA